MCKVEEAASYVTACILGHHVLGDDKGASYILCIYLLFHLYLPGHDETDCPSISPNLHP